MPRRCEGGQAPRLATTPQKHWSTLNSLGGYVDFFLIDNIVKSWELQLRSLQLRRLQLQVRRREKGLTLHLDL